MSKTDSQSVNVGERRRQVRLDISIPVTVRGEDSHGNSFEETTTTIDFSPEGASFLLKRDLRIGTELVLSLAVSAAGEHGDYATVADVRRVEEDSQPQCYKIAVKFHWEKPGWRPLALRAARGLQQVDAANLHLPATAGQRVN